MEPLSIAGSQLYGGVKGGAGGSAGPANAMQEGGMFDSSGWNVNFGAGKIESSRGLDLGQYAPYLAIVAAGVALWKILKR